MSSHFALNDKKKNHLKKVLWENLWITITPFTIADIAYQWSTSYGEPLKTAYFTQPSTISIISEFEMRL